MRREQPIGGGTAQSDLSGIRMQFPRRVPGLLLIGPRDEDILLGNRLFGCARRIGRGAKERPLQKEDEQECGSKDSADLPEAVPIFAG